MKPKHRIALEQRAVNALQDLYHNATPPWGSFEDTPEHLADWLDVDPHQFLFDWVAEVAGFEIDYINDGGAYGGDYAETLRVGFAREYPEGERKARECYIRKGMRQMRMDRTKGGRWERISEYGHVYQWGRGGRTVAPESLITTRGGSSFGIAEHITEDMNAEQLTDLALTVEAFNRYASAVCSGFAFQWTEYLEGLQNDYDAEKTALAVTAARELEATRPDMYTLA